MPTTWDEILSRAFGTADVPVGTPVFLVIDPTNAILAVRSQYADAVATRDELGDNCAVHHGNWLDAAPWWKRGPVAWEIEKCL